MYLGFEKPAKLFWIGHACCLLTFPLKFHTCGHGLDLVTCVLLLGTAAVVCDVLLQTLLAHWREVRSF